MSDWTPELAKEMRERCSQATPGPWERTPNDGIKAWLEPPEDVPGHQRIAETVYWQDSEFVAHARTDLPAALDRVEAQDKEIGRITAFMHRLKMHPDYEYTETTGARKCFDEDPPSGEGWERNVHRGRNGWERFDYHEEAYWMRKREDR